MASRRRPVLPSAVIPLARPRLSHREALATLRGPGAVENGAEGEWARSDCKDGAESGSVSRVAPQRGRQRRTATPTRSDLENAEATRIVARRAVTVACSVSPTPPGSGAEPIDGRPGTGQRRTASFPRPVPYIPGTTLDIP